MSKEKKSTGALLGEAMTEFSHFLTLLFCALRACDVITWPWYWVMSPIFITWIVGFAALFFVGALAIAVVNDKD